MQPLEAFIAKTLGFSPTIGFSPTRFAFFFWEKFEIFIRLFLLHSKIGFFFWEKIVVFIKMFLFFLQRLCSSPGKRLWFSSKIVSFLLQRLGFSSGKTL